MAHILLAEDPRSVSEACRAWRDNRLFVYPTDTVYGLGGNPSSIDVHRNIVRVKRSVLNKPHLTLTDTWDRVADWIDASGHETRSLMQFAASQPVTVVMSASDTAPRHLVSIDGMIGIRITRHPFCLALIERCQGGIVSTSANLTGHASPMTCSDVEEDLLNAVDLVIDDGATAGAVKPVPSTIVSVKHGRIEILREGSVPSTIVLDALA